MPRQPCCRRVSGSPAASYFKPAGIPVRMLEEIVLALDEFEAIRLADLEGLYQEQGAERMKVSRPTFGRIIDSARRKIAEALVTGKALRIEGGPVYAEAIRAFRCPACENEWEGPAGAPAGCPRCNGEDAVRCCRRRRVRNVKNDQNRATHCPKERK
jgi:uncharacterized protein